MVWERLFKLGRAKRNQANRKKNQRRKLLMQQLDSRQLLAGDMGAIGGIAFIDQSGNGLTPDDARQENVQIELFLDDGDGVFNAADTLQTTVQTGAGPINTGRITGTGSGEYRFDGLAAATYHIVQDDIVGVANPSPLTVTITNVTGDASARQQIDDFSVNFQTIAADTVTPTASDSVLAGEAIGGARDIRVTNTNNQGQVSILVDSAADQLAIGSTGDGLGTALVQYDGNDGTDTLDPTGLGGVSLAGDVANAELDPGAGLLIRTRAENAGDDLVVTLFTDAGNSSSTTFPIPQNLASFEDVWVLFSDFTTASGTGADFNNIGAIEMSVTLSANNDVFAEILEARTPLLVEASLPNTQLLELGGVLWEDNGTGLDSNNGFLDPGETIFGAGIQVDLFRRDATDGSLDPAVDTVFAMTTTAADGTYNFGDLEPDDYLVVIPDSQFAATQPLFGFAESTGIDPANDPDDDVDSDDNGRLVPGVGITSGIVTLVSNDEPINDDDADPNTNTTLDFGLLPQIDLAITKTLNVGLSDVQTGGVAVFDILVENLGPLDATGVSVEDLIPDGLTFDAAQSDFGTFANSLAGSTLTVGIGDVAANGDVTFQVGFNIGPTEFADLTNNAEVSGNEIETNDANNTDDAVVELNSADLVVTKTDLADPVNAGTELVYQITVRNDGPDGATNVVATDILPAEVTFVSQNFTTGSGTVTEDTPGELTITLGDLANGESETVEITVLVNEDASSPLNNVVNVIADPNNDPNPDNNSDTEPTQIDRVVDVAIDKSVTGTPVAGQNVTYTLVVNNNGPGEARNVAVTDVLDGRLEFVSFDALGSGVTVNQSGQSLSFDVGTLASGAIETFSFVASIAASATGVIPNLAEVTTSDDDTIDANNEDNVDITVQSQIDLILNKDVNLATAVAGQDQLVYTITVEHDIDSPSDAQNVVVTDLLPDGLSLTQANISAPDSTSTSFNSATREASITFDSLPVGETRTITITATVDQDVIGTITNPASVTADGTELDLSNNDDTAVTVVNPEFDVTITKSVDDQTVSPGDTVTYTIGIANDGPSTATGVVLTDDVPAGLTFVSGTLDGQTASLQNGDVTFPAVTLLDDASLTATLIFTVDAAANGQIINTANVTSDNGETNLNNNQAQAEITVTPETDITVAKQVDLAAAQAGSNLLYTVTVTNNGPAIASSVQAIDTLPPGVTFVSGTGPNNEALSASGGQVTVNGGDLAIGASFTFTINATVNSGTIADQINTVVVSTTTTETNTANNSASAITTIDPVLSSIAGTVYIDANNNGFQDAGEAGIAGVTLELTGTDAFNNAVNRTAITDANGDYLFANLAAGTYQVEEIQPVGFRDGQEDAGQNAPSTVGDDVFTQIGLGANVDAVEFDFGELNDSLSKRRFLASS